MSIIFSTIVGLFSSIGYKAVFFLMVIESSFIPFPSEIIILPAAYSASHNDLNIYLIVLFGTLGSLMGALLNYYIALRLGRAMIYKLVNSKYSKYLLLKQGDLVKTDVFFEKHGGLSTFIGRLIPVIRQLISLPAGFAKMKISSFIFFTTIGALIWVSILAFIGFNFGSYLEVIFMFFKKASYLGYFLIFLLFVFILQKLRNKK